MFWSSHQFDMSVLTSSFCSSPPPHHASFFPSRGLSAMRWWKRSNCHSRAREEWNTSDTMHHPHWRRTPWSTCTPSTSGVCRERTAWPATALQWRPCFHDMPRWWSLEAHAQRFAREHGLWLWNGNSIYTQPQRHPQPHSQTERWCGQQPR